MDSLGFRTCATLAGRLWGVLSILSKPHPQDVNFTETQNDGISEDQLGENKLRGTKEGGQRPPSDHGGTSMWQTARIPAALSSDPHPGR